MREIVGRQAQFLAEMIDGVLNFSRCQNGKLPLSKVHFDLAKVIFEAVETVQPLVTGRKHLLTLSLPREPLPIFADLLCASGRSWSIFLTNATRYTRSPYGRIDVSAEFEADDVVIEVRDNGRGIHRDLLPRIFDLFQQGDQPGEGEGSGLGIGLALVKSIVNLHDGEISAHSDGPGLGSTFTVRLPGGRRAINAAADAFDRSAWLELNL